jgi:sortase A
MRSTLRWTRLILTACAVALLGYSGFVWLDARDFQKAEDRKFQSALVVPQQPAGAVSLASLSPAATGGLIGRIDVSRLGISVMVMEGTTARTLRRAAGHIPGTALPGQPGNVGISAHRDTFFRPLRNVEPNDVITLTTLAGEYRYHVLSTRIVSPSDVSVLDPGDGETLTLVTCYPFYFVGPAPNRFVVKAERIT